ncbi:MAG: ArsR/SmtB family transcription factor [Halobacterium sp.]
MSQDAEDAFAAVADELRVRILRELWDADDPLSFSELRSRVDVDDSGRFNYHLGELRGRFVEQREAGYALRFAGRELVGALHSGVFTEEASVDPQPVDGDCLLCGGELEAAYEDEQARVTCRDCDAHVISVGIPPAFLDGRDEDLAAAIDGYVRTMARQFSAGFCSACRGPTEGRLEASDGHGAEAIFECRRCGNVFRGFVAAAVLEHTEVLAFYRDHGLDARDVPVWEMEWTSTAEFDGDTAVVRVELGGDELAVTVDDSLAVVDAQRT